MGKNPAYMTCGPGATRVLAEVASQQHPTVKRVADRTGLAQSTVHSHLQTLQRHRLIGWAAPTKDGTLRALVRFEPVREAP